MDFSLVGDQRVLMKMDLLKIEGSQELDFPTDDSSSFFDRISARILNQKNNAKPAAGLNSPKTTEALLFLQNYEETRQGWFWSTDKAGNITYITESLAKAFDKSQKELLGTPFIQLFINPDDEARSSQRTLNFILAKQSSFNELQLKAAIEGSDRWWSVSGKPQLDNFDKFDGYRGNGRDITAQLRSEDETSKLVMFDSLTGLANRTSISKKLASTLDSFASQKRSCAVLLLDLDRFKQVNDTLGHLAGDELLKQVAKRLLNVVGNRGEVSRIGGDEFQIMLPDSEDRGELGELSGTIISHLSQPYSVDGSRCVVGVSIGIAISPFDGRTTEELINGADLALYAAKGSGRGRFHFFSKDLQQTAKDRRILEDDLRDAISNDKLFLAYQPIVNAKNDTVRGVEALMRWNHHERGPVSPAQFIPIAEEANLIKSLGEWAINRACLDAVKWPNNFRVAVNVSPIQFADGKLPGIVSKALKQSGLPPERLELEITESVFLEGSEKTDKMFADLKNIGVRLALDDFGTGYSSLSYLQTAPFDKIKIDQSFVRGATIPGSRNGAIITAIVALAEALGMETTAEGIEAMDELAWIRDLNVSHVQGFVYSMAVQADELLRLIENGQWIVKPNGPAKHRQNRISLYRKVRAIHENYCYSVMIRNISVTGALMEGLSDVPVGTKFVIDFGDGQLVLAVVRRSQKMQQGIEFEERLVSDGNGGLCTRRRVSPYLIAAAGMQIPNIPSDFYPKANVPPSGNSLPAFYTANDRI